MAVSHAGEADPAGLLQAADSAMYTVKRASRPTLQVLTST